MGYCGGRPDRSEDERPGAVRSEGLLSTYLIYFIVIDMKERNKFTVVALVVLLVGSYGTGGLDISRDGVVDLVEDAV